MPRMTRRPLVIVGFGGFGREVQDVVDAVNAGGSEAVELVGFLDDGEPDPALLAAAEVPHLGGVTALERLPRDVDYVIAVGAGTVRRRIDDYATGVGRAAATLIHPSARIGRRLVKIGPGSIICANVSVTTNIVLGRHVHLNLGVTVGHEAALGDFVTVNPNASISGGVVLEDEVTIGTCACVVQGLTVGARTTVGAGAAVVKDLPAEVTAVGVPARPLRPPV